MSTLNDAFDGYQSMREPHGATGPCRPVTRPPSTTRGPALDRRFRHARVHRAVRLLPQTIGALTVSRKVYVPTNDTYAAGSTSSPIPRGASDVNMITSNNPGSDSNTKITGSSSGDNVAQTTDPGVSSSRTTGTTSSDVRPPTSCKGRSAHAGLDHLLRRRQRQAFWTTPSPFSPARPRSLPTTLQASRRTPPRKRRPPTLPATVPTPSSALQPSLADEPVHRLAACDEPMDVALLWWARRRKHDSVSAASPDPQLIRITTASARARLFLFAGALTAPEFYACAEGIADQVVTHPSKCIDLEHEPESPLPVYGPTTL